MLATDLQKFQYYLIPPRNPPSHFAELIDKTFTFWQSIWQPTLHELGYSDQYLHDDFIRQDAISVLTFDNQVIGVFLYSFFNLEIKTHYLFRYFKNNYNSYFFSRIKELGVKKVLTTQYLAVHPEWRGKKNPIIPVALTLAGLSNYVRDHYGLDAGIGPTRRDHKVTELFYAHGGDCIVSDVPNHNVLCDLIANIKGRTHQHPNPQIQQIQDYLWYHRIDATLNFNFKDTTIYEQADLFIDPKKYAS